MSVILTLMLAIGANIATLSLFYGYLLAPLPYPHSGRLMNVHFVSRKNFGKLQMSYPTYFDLRARTPAIEVAGMSKSKNLDLEVGGRVLHVTGAAVSASFFTTLGVHPLIGRVFAPTANRPGAAGEAILSDRLWSLLDAQKTSSLGQTIRLNGALYTVIGVMPQAFQYPNPETRLWIPKVIRPFDHNPDNLTAFHDHMIARLMPGASLAALNAQMGAVVAREIAHFPDPSAIPLFRSYGLTVVAQPLRHSLVGSLRQNLLLVQLATALVLVLAWVNLSNLFIARALTERGTLLLRRIFGADLHRLFGRLFAESLVLCLAG
ncbi:permease, partial [mine drainage metagenome]